MRFLILLFLSVYLLPLQAQDKTPAANHFYYSPKILADLGYFGTAEEIAGFFDFNCGDRIADIGGESGEYSSILSLMFDNLHFTVEDLNKKKLNQKKLNKNVAKFSKLRKAPQNCTFDFVIGTNMTTNLKDSSYDVLFLKSAFHEIGFIEEMITDMGKKLKPGGKIIVMDVFSTPGKSVYCKEGHRGYTIKEACELMKHHDFHLTGMSNPASDVPNYANALIFERNNEKSQNFVRDINGTKVLENQIKRLSHATLANDSVSVKLLCDSIKIQFAPLQKNYQCFESWLTGFGIVHFENKNFVAAKNVFNLVKELYPKSYLPYYWLGETAFIQNSLNWAYTWFLKSVQLNNSNTDAIQKVTLCRKKLGIPEEKILHK